MHSEISRWKWASIDCLKCLARYLCRWRQNISDISTTTSMTQDPTYNDTKTHIGRRQRLQWHHRAPTVVSGIMDTFLHLLAPSCTFAILQSVDGRDGMTDIHAQGRASQLPVAVLRRSAPLPLPSRFQVEKQVGSIELMTNMPSSSFQPINISYLKF